MPLSDLSLKGFRRFYVGSLAIMKDFFSQFVPHRMTRYEMLELSWRLREMAKRTCPPHEARFGRRVR